jgi:hypothetical protein
MNDDLLPEHADIDASLAAIRREHAKRLATVLDLDAGLTAILTPDENAGRGEPASAKSGPMASSRGGMPPSGGQAAVMIAARFRVLDLIRASAHVLDLALALASAGHLGRRRSTSCHDCGVRVQPEDLICFRCGANLPPVSGVDEDTFATARGLGRDLTLVSDLAIDLARDLAGDLAGAHAIVYDFAEALGSPRQLARDLAEALARPRDPDVARHFARELHRSLNQAVRDLVSQFDAVEVDASGADLSTLHIRDMSALEGVLWTQETTWPPSVREEIRMRSREIRPGVYQVRGGDKRDLSELIVTGR